MFQTVKPPWYVWVIIREVATGKAHFGGWATATSKGYVFRDRVPAYPAGAKPEHYVCERRPIKDEGRIW